MNDRPSTPPDDTEGEPRATDAQDHATNEVGEEPRTGTRGTEKPSGHDAGSTGGERHPAAGGGAPVAGVPHPHQPPRRSGIFIDPEDLRTHVGGLLRAVLGGYEVDAFGNFTFTHEGARVFITVAGSPMGPQVGVFCVTNLDIELTPPLGEFLLRTNHTLGFGSFSYDARNEAVWLRHTLLGTTLDLPELQAAVAAIATTAAQLDETIRDRFGGRTFEDAPGEVQRGMEPPEPAQSHAGGVSGYL